MLANRIIPCLDVRDGRVVKGIKFVDLQDCGDPGQLGLRYYEEGADELMFLDIEATYKGRQTRLDWVSRVANSVFVPFAVGGGIDSVDQIQELLKAGADKVSINSAAVKRPELISEGAREFGSQCIVTAVDVKKKGKNWGVYTAGGRIDSGLDAVEWILELADRGAGEFLITSMDRDGTCEGYDLEFLSMITEMVAVPVIASGGVGELKHLAAGLRAGAQAVLAASIFHYGRHTVGEAKKFLYDNGFSVRL
jgi:cyclase